MPDGDIKLLGDLLRNAMPIARNRPTDTIQKSAQDYVTDIDLALDKYLLENLPSIRNVPVLSEERAVAAGKLESEYWIVDPLDGTANFMSGLSMFAISVALVDENGPVMSAILSGQDGNLWCAVRGGGAYRDDAKLDLTNGSQPSELIVLSTGMLDAMVADHQHAYKSFRKVGKIRNIGSQALQLCHVAGGQFSAVVSREAKIWDEAAGGLIVREAGGIWDSRADTADWTQPSSLMGQDQCSVAAHPDKFATIKNVADTVFESFPVS